MENKSFLKGNDYFFTGSVIVVFSIWIFTLANSITNTEAGLIPKVVIGFMGLMGLCMVIDSIIKFKKGKDESSKVTKEEILAGILLPGSLLIIATLLLKPIGFYLASFILVIAIFILQTRVSKGKIDFKLKYILFILLFSVATTVLMYILFNLVFGLPTPKGILGF